MQSWLVLIVIVDVIASLSLLAIAKRMNATRVSSPGLIFGLLFIFLGAMTFGAMGDMAQMMFGSMNLNPATKAEVTRATEQMTRWRDFIWMTQVMIGAGLLSRWALND